MNDESEQSLDDLTGPEVIRDFVTRLPGKPGVYRMVDAKGDVIYVGKARNLKNRVSSYTRAWGHSSRIATMIGLTVTMEFVTTATEAEALLLEANLIKKLKPRFNVVLRDDKSFPYILIAHDHRVAQLAKHRGARGRKGSYFGPFASAGAVNRAINTLQKAFLLRTCSDSVFANRTRPCLLYQIKRCSAPCVDYIEEAAYGALVAEAEAFLNGKSQTVKADLATAMEASAEALDFEQAASFRDRIQAMSFVTQTQGINPQKVDEADVFGLAQEGGQACVQVFFFRSGQNWGTRAYFPRADKSMEAAEILGSFVSQFYDDKPIPKLVLLSHEIEDVDAAGRGAFHPCGPQGGGAGAATGRKARPGRACGDQRAGSVRPEDCRILIPGQAAGRGGGGLWPGGARQNASKSMIIRTFPAPIR